MPKTFTIDPTADFKIRCRDLRDAELAVNRPSALARIKYLNPQKTACEFAVFDGRECAAMPSAERAKLIAALPIMQRVIVRFRAELLSVARRRPDGHIYLNFFNSRPNVKKSTARKVPAKKNPKKASPRQFFDTFDDGSSVWTVPSNWKQRDS